ncbi:serine hydrolase domain-containing protein [Pedobacter sp. UYP1]|uniref:serine hydrolase domain-containing protein n=1 Tax=Pedobacter sp. UYP1 TaxID=1756396 RepID=UPI00339A76A3
MKTYILLLLTWVCNPQLLSAQTNDSLATKIDTIFKLYNHTKGPGAAVAIIRDGQVILKRSYGMANLEYNMPITSTSVFDIASLAKQFTGLAISTLIQERKLAVNDDIRKYLPDVPDFGKTITIGNLLHHTSGLRDFPEALMAAGWNYSEVCSFEEVMKLVKHQKELDFEPGTKESYSNTGYNLLAAIVEKVTGKSFVEWTGINIFKPLGMNSSQFINYSNIIIPNLATSYYGENNDYGKYHDVLTAYGSSSMYSSLDDLSKWVIHFQAMVHSKNPVYMRMIEGASLNNGEKVNYGYGLRLEERLGLKTIEHTGAWIGYRTNIINFPEQNLSLVILNNAGDNQVGGIYANELINLFFKNNKILNENRVELIKNIPTQTLNISLLKKYTGDFMLDIDGGVPLSFTIDSGRLVNNNIFGSTILEAKSDSTFYIAKEQAAIIFGNSADGLSHVLTYRNSTTSIKGNRVAVSKKKLKPFLPGAEQLKLYTGNYYSEELQATYKVDFVKGELQISHFRRGEFKLIPNKDLENQFKAAIGIIDFYRDKGLQIAGFKLSGSKIVNMRFRKIS